MANTWNQLRLLPYQPKICNVKLKQMFKMMSLCTDAEPESLPPFTNGHIDDCLLHGRPHLDQALFQLIHVTYGLLVHMFLNTATNLIMGWVKVRAVRCP